MNGEYAQVPVADIVTLLQDIELNYPVSEWTANDLHIWPLLRILIASEIRKLNYPPTSNQKKNARSKTFAAWKTILLNRKNSAKLFSKPGRIALFGISTGKTITENGYYNQYLDPLASFFSREGLPSVIIERDKRNCSGFPRKTSSVYLSYQSIAPLLRFLSKLQSLRTIKYYLPEIDGMTEALGKYCDSHFILSLAEITKRYKKTLSYARFFHLLLRIIRPSCVIIQCFYSLDSMALCLSCKKLNIPTYDYQHGVQGRSHYAYGEWGNKPGNGYELLPDGYLVWDSYSALNLKNTISHPENVFIIGNLWYEFIADAIPGMQAKSEFLLKLSGGRNIVLYTLQDFDPPEWILNLIKETNTFFWLIRLHPQYQQHKEYIRSFLFNCENYNIEEASEIPLPLVLHLSILHITGCSSVVLEAASVGMRSAVTDEIGKAYYSDLIEKDIVTYAPSHDSLLDFIQLNQNGNQLMMEGILNEREICIKRLKGYSYGKMKEEYGHTNLF